MNWDILVNIASTVACLLPIIIIIFLRLYHHFSIIALLIYFLITAVYQLMKLGVIPVSEEVTRLVGTANNYLDAPLMLLVLHLFYPDGGKIRGLQVAIAIMALYELFIAFYFRFSVASNSYVLGPAVAFILFFSVQLFIRQIRLTVVQNKSLGKTLMLASIVFSYGCFSIIYLFHYIFQVNAVNDVLLLYHLSSLISSVLMCIGLFHIRRYMKELEELRNTRRELKLFFHT